MTALDLSKLGASDMPAVVGVDEHRTAWGVYARMVHGYSEETGEPAEWGNRLEPVIIQAFAERFSLPAIFKPPTRYPSKRPWSRVSVDSLAPPGVHLECKSIGEWRWRDEADAWGEDGSAHVAERVRVQTHVQIETMRSEADYWRDAHRIDPMAIDATHVAVLVGGNELRCFRVPYDPELGGLLFQTAERFIRDYVEPRRWPPADDSEGCARYIAKTYPRAEGVIREATAEEIETLRLLHMMSTAEKATKVTREGLENQIRLAIGSDLGIRGGDFVAKHSNRAGSVRWKDVAEELARFDGVDLNEFAEAHRGDGSRTLSVKFGGER